MRKDIFDIGDVSDLPEELRSQLSRRKSGGGIRGRILGLLPIGEKAGVTVLQVTAAYYRSHKDSSMSVKKMTCHLSCLNTKNLICSTDGKPKRYWKAQ